MVLCFSDSPRKPYCGVHVYKLSPGAQISGITLCHEPIIASQTFEQLIITVSIGIMGTMIRLTVDDQRLRQELVADRSYCAVIRFRCLRQRSFTVKLAGIPFHNGNKNSSKEPIRRCNDLIAVIKTREGTFPEKESRTTGSEPHPANPHCVPCQDEDPHEKNGAGRLLR